MSSDDFPAPINYKKNSIELIRVIRMPGQYEVMGLVEWYVVLRNF